MSGGDASHRKYTRPIALGRLEVAKRKAASNLKVFVAGPYVKNNWTEEEAASATPGAKLRAQLIKTVQSLEHTPVIGEHRGVAEVTGETIPSTGNVVLSELQLVEVPSLSKDRVTAVFQSLGYTERVADQLADLTTLGGYLPQGAPTSPMIANLALRDFDARMVAYAEVRDYRYTRYADDITLSAPERISDEAVELITLLLGAVELRLNPRKSRFLGPNDQHEVTGVVLGKDSVNLPRDYLNACRGWFHSAGANPSQFIDQVSRLRGTLSLVKQVRGAGSSSVIALGEAALDSIASFQKVPPSSPPTEV